MRSRSICYGVQLLAMAACASIGTAQSPAFPPEFTPAQLLSLTYARTELVDLNGDGRLDLLGWYGGLPLQLHVGRTNGVFADPPAPLPLPYDLRIGVGDLDGDGDVDLIETRYSSSARIFWNDGNASFTAGPTLAFAGDTWSEPQIADYDADGRADIALLTQANHAYAVAYFFDDGTGSFASSVVRALPGRADALAAIDLDRRAPHELVVTSSAGALSSIFTSGGRNFFERSLGTASYATRIDQVVDVDADGQEDLILSGTSLATPPYQNRGVSLLHGDGAGGLRSETVLYAGPRLVRMVHAGNVDTRGALDLIVAFDDGLLVWTSRSIFPTELALPFHPALGSALSAASAGDVDADGDLDLVGYDLRSFGARIWSNRARFELRVPFDETAGTSVWDAARADGRGPRFNILGNARWQGDPGAGREAFRGNDAGSGVLACGSQAWLANTGILGGPPFSASGSCTIAWWQRMGGTAPQQYVALLNAAGFQVLTGVAPQTDRLVVLRDPATFPNGLPPLVSATAISTPHRWLHIAIVFDAATRQVQLYFDGTADGAAVPAGSLPQGGLDFVLMGAPTSGPPATTWFDFDELRYIPRRLSASEIPELLRGGALTIASMGEGCFERRATEGLSMSLGAVPGGLVDIVLDTTGTTSGVAAIAFGLSSAQLGGIALPLDLGYGCLLRTSLDVLVPVNAGGVATLGVPLPRTPGALQGHVHVQGLIFGVGLQTTRAFDLKLRY